VGHEVRTAYQMGWSNLGNGKLLEQAAKQFDVFITVDQNIEYQQKLAAIPISIVILVAIDNDPATLKPYGPFVLHALANLSGRQLIRIYADGRIETIVSTT
jgi:hypothetical protein